MSKTMAQLIKEVQTVKQYAEKVDAQNEILRESNATLHADYALLEEKYYTQDAINTKLAVECVQLEKEVETLKKDRDNFERNFNNVNECYEGIYDNYEKLKSDYANINAENHALKQEIERTNRHINLAENVIHEAKEQQPLVVNHYHNCTINK